MQREFKELEAGLMSKEYRKLSELTDEYFGSFAYEDCPITQDIEEIKEWLENYDDFDEEEEVGISKLELRVAIPFYLKPLSLKVFEKGEEIDPDYWFGNMAYNAHGDYKLEKDSPIYKAVEHYNKEKSLYAFSELNKIILESKEIICFGWSNIYIEC